MQIAAPSMSAGVHRNLNIQVLRAFAAWAVVGYHVLDALRNYIAIGRFGWSPAFGSYGVEVFFVISGYVMMTTSLRPIGPGRFILDRLIRLVPLYWALTLCVALALASGLKLFSHTPFSLGWLASSLLFLPMFDGRQVVAPMLFPGWTLNYEMMFYVLFAGCLLLRKPTARAWVVSLVISLAVAAQWAFPTPLAQYLGRDVIAGFALGAILWLAANRWSIPGRVAQGLLAAGVIGLVAIDMSTRQSSRHVELAITAAALLVVAGAVFMDKTGKRLGGKWLTAQGDASYALYLVHPFALQLVGKLSIKSGLNATTPGLAATVVLMVVASGVLGTGIHLLLEKPVQARLKRFARSNSTSGRQQDGGNELPAAEQP